MYAEFSYDLVPGALTNDIVLSRILERFVLKPNGDERLRCDVLSDSFICEIANAKDFEAINEDLIALREELGEQFSYTFSLHPRGAPIRIEGAHNRPLAKKIVTA
jgi:hypothetical protein